MASGHLGSRSRRVSGALDLGRRPLSRQPAYALPCAGTPTSMFGGAEAGSGRRAATPATKYGRFPRLRAYAQAADQRVCCSGLRPVLRGERCRWSWLLRRGSYGWRDGLDGYLEHCGLGITLYLVPAWMLPTVSAVRHHASELIAQLDQTTDSRARTPLTLRIYNPTASHVGDTEMTWADLSSCAPTSTSPPTPPASKAPRFLVEVRLCSRT